MKKTTDVHEWINQPEVKLSEQVEGFETLEKIKAYTADLEAPKIDSEALFERIKAKRQASKKVSQQHFSWLRYAAVFLVLTASLFFIRQLSTQTYSTQIAETKQILLPDNSEVFLKPETQISYNSILWTFNRSLSLDGEAFFKVYKGERFRVKTKQATVEVLGTQFNVKSRADNFSVLCTEGKVAVLVQNNKEILTAGMAFNTKNDHYEISENHQLTFSNSEDYYFIKAGFKTITNELTRIYGVDFQINIFENNKTFTGSIPVNNLKEALNIITTTYQIKANKINENTFIFVDDE
ncbi:MAG: FecR family protein [Flavobacteriaceae bacterium]|nr:FecR family protein [Flavobacteriaceae bacterium]